MTLYLLCTRPQVTVLGTPAEEDVGGKIDLLREGAFQGIDVVFMAHPSKEDATYLPCVAEHEYDQCSTFFFFNYHITILLYTVYTRYCR